MQDFYVFKFMFFRFLGFNTHLKLYLHTFYSGQCLECVFSFIGVFVVVVVVQDYSWEDHGFSLVNRLLPDMGQFLDEKFQVHSTLTN